MNRLLLIFLVFFVYPSIGHAAQLLMPPSFPGYDFRNKVFLQDDFVSGGTTSGSIGLLGWGFSSGTTSLLVGESDRVGILRKDTGSVSGTVAALLLSVTQPLIVATLTAQVTFITRVNTVDTNTTVRIGMGSGATVSPISSGVYFEKLDADTNWFAVSLGGGSTRIDTGIAVNTTFTTFSIVRTAAVDIQYFINGTLVATISSNMPTVGINPFLHIVNSAVAAKTLDLDYFEGVVQVTR